MPDKKFLFVFGGAFLLIVALIWWGLGEDQAKDDPAAIVYYYGEGCPHCKTINEFLEENKVSEKVSFEKKEVWGNKTNARELDRRAQACKVSPEGMGVPFVYGGDGRCYIGEPDVRKFFSEKAGIDLSSGEKKE
ncbi:MAG: hypothetical protein HYV45_00205 [Candidatus Moranbacteria bacterium]|nr:hypothetical protein [Candidatus Moranbacteria bacterium]